jgi:spore coat polysaccharide biosynthesis predicted glycosyltransferase SpsG
VYVIRCDEGNAQNGYGHELRCRAIADELEALGEEVGFFTSPLFVRRGDTLILDSRTAEIDFLHGRGDGLRIVVIDDPIGPDRDCDIAFYPPTPQALRLDWTGSDCDVKIGWKWLPMRKLPEPLPPSERSGVFVANDSFGLLKRTALVGLPPAVNRGDYIDTMNGSELVVCAGGMTGYEAAALGIPSIHVCPNNDVGESSAGLRSAVHTIDGLGAQRIASYLVETA